MITIEINDAQVRAVLDRLAQRGRNPRAALLEIGEELRESTLRRFSTSTAPDGSKWAPNSPSTLARKKGNKPLIGAGKALSTQIHYRVVDDAVYIGSPMKYAAVQQFGAKMGEFGRYYQLFRQKYGEKDFRRYAGMKTGSPIPWGDIPARPFLGLSADDRKAIEAIVRDYMVE